MTIPSSLYFANQGLLHNDQDKRRQKLLQPHQNLSTVRFIDLLAGIYLQRTSVTHFSLYTKSKTRDLNIKTNKAKVRNKFSQMK